MKIRSGFVSNSSSSSFILTAFIEDAKEILKKDGYDYYEFNNKLYTSAIGDWSDTWDKIYDLSIDEIESYEQENGEHKWIGVEGERGLDTVYLPKEEYLNSIKNDNKIAEEVLFKVQKFIKRHNIFCDECIYDDDYIAECSLEFIEDLCNTVGYTERSNNED